MNRTVALDHESAMGVRWIMVMANYRESLMTTETHPDQG
jgi:hypothetical protein